MFSQQQCEIARTLTKDKALDEQINSEYQTMTPADKVNSAMQIDKLCKEHNDSFDKAFPIIADDCEYLPYFSSHFVLCLHGEQTVISAEAFNASAFFCETGPL